MLSERAASPAAPTINRREAEQHDIGRSRRPGFLFPAWFALIVSTACSGNPGGRFDGPAAGPVAASAQSLVAVLGPAFDATVGNGDYAVVLLDPVSSPSSSEPEASVNAQSIRLLAAERGAEFRRESRDCRCKDPYAGETRSGVDVPEGECDWIASLERAEAQASFHIDDVDLDKGTATVNAMWRVYTPDRGPSNPCSYSRMWTVDLARVDDGWEVVSASCHIAFGVAGFAIDRRPMDAMFRWPDPVRTGCRGGMFWTRSDGGSPNSPP